jgi:crotonobetainyl-CoA:carnitine CoA-transferase CaiB-like acyl-CoA transferase
MPKDPRPDDLPLAGVVVAEWGDRLAVGAAGSLLAQLGATVVLIEPPTHPPARDDKWAQRDLTAAGKLSLVARADDAALAHLLDTADVVLTSRDLDAAAPPASRDAIVCDITACGTEGPLAGQPLTDADIQALCGIADTTGASDGPPVTVGAPVIEMAAALYGASAIVAALRGRHAGAPGQTIAVALYDCAIHALTTFLPTYFGGRVPTRIGNAHPLLGPWNVFPTTDGWVLICSASDPQWQRLSALIGRPDLGADPRFARVHQRIAGRAELEPAIAAWSRQHTRAECLAAVGDANIPCGPILTLADLPDEPNLKHRAMVRTLRAPDGRALRIAGSPFRAGVWHGRVPERIPARDADRAAIMVLPARRAAPTSGSPRPPLAGLRVIEIGQYTTAPLAARHLLAFGAEVVRVEPPGGEPARAWTPGQDGLSYFFVMVNAGKRAVALDLASEAGQAGLAALLRDADVLIENLKPGALARLGFDAQRLAALNPRLIHCAISGFGEETAYPERPAFDAVVQAMSGLMDLTRGEGRGGDGTPYKAGISAADLGGGQVALLAVLAALLQRDRSGQGQVIDLSMQDAACWMTQGAWNPPGRAQPPAPARAATIADTATHPHTAARGVLFERRDEAGKRWYMLGAPARLSATPMALPDPEAGLLDWDAFAAAGLWRR